MSIGTFSDKGPGMDLVGGPESQRVEVPLFEVYRNLVENSLDAMLLTDPAGAGRVLAANPEACRMLGWERQ